MIALSISWASVAYKALAFIGGWFLVSVAFTVVWARALTPRRQAERQLARRRRAAVRAHTLWLAERAEREQQLLDEERELKAMQREFLRIMGAEFPQ